MTIDLTRIILAVIALIFAIITRYVIPWVNANTSAKKRQGIVDVVESVVEAVDRFMKTATGEEKKAQVVKYLEERGYTVNINDITDEMNMLIESAVEKLRIKQNASQNVE